MAELFGIDIREVVASALASAGNLRPGVLLHNIEATRSADDPTETIQPDPTRHTIQGFVSVRQRQSEDPDLRNRNEQIMTIVGGSIVPFVEPTKGDKCTIDEKTYTLGDLRTVDPAQAVFEFVAD